MVNNLCQAIDIAIDKKLNQGVVVNGNVKDLAKYSKYNNLKRHQLNNFVYNFKNLSFEETRVKSVKKDLYDNQLYNYLRVKKTQCRFNLIKLFEPGELLNSVMGS